MAFFNKFPKAAYDFNREGVVNNIVDIFRQVRPLQNFVDEFSSYRYYEIQDGERPDILSKKLYDNPDYYWTFFIINDSLHDGLSSWPMSQQDLDEYIAKEYNGYALETRPNIKRDTDGGIEEFENSLAGTVAGQNQGGFTPGTTVTLTRGGVTTATGTIRRKDIYLNQLIIQDVTGTPVSNGTGNIVENCSGFHTDPGGCTYMFYLNHEWDESWGGHTEFKNDNIMERVAPKPGRLVIFDARWNHRGTQPSHLMPDRVVGRLSLAFQERS